MFIEHAYSGHKCGGIQQIEAFSNLKNLEYIEIEDTFRFPAFPDSFASLTKLRYFALEQTEISELPLAICNLMELEVIWLIGELQIESVPDCLDNLRNLKLFMIDISPLLSSFPLSLLSLPKLELFSLSRNSISWDNVLNDNLPSNISRGDTESVRKWLDENFVFSNQTDYYLVMNPICDENVSFVTPKISDFMDRACDFPVDISDDIDALNTFFMSVPLLILRLFKMTGRLLRLPVDVG